MKELFEQGAFPIWKERVTLPARNFQNYSPVELHQKVVIPVDRQTVWLSLNEPTVLRQCLPGCESFSASGGTHFDFVIAAKVGPVKARFSGQVELSEIVPMISYTISGSGKGGAAGFGKGHARVVLEDQDSGTTLTYRVEVGVGGKLAQIGSRLVAAAAKKMANDFFTAFVRVVCNDAEMAVEVVTIET